MFNTTADAGAGTQTPNSEGQVQAQTPVPKTYTQEEFDRATAALRRAEEDKASEYKKKAKEYDALAAKMKEKEEAELSELDKLKKRLAELEPLSSQVKEYEQSFTELLTKRLEQVPEEKRGLVPDLPPRQKLAWLESAFAAGLFGDQVGITSPPSGMPPTTPSDPIRQKAEAELMLTYPDPAHPVRKNPEEWEKRVQMSMLILRNRGYSASSK